MLPLGREALQKIGSFYWLRVFEMRQFGGQLTPGHFAIWEPHGLASVKCFKNQLRTGKGNRGGHLS